VGRAWSTPSDPWLLIFHHHCYAIGNGATPETTDLGFLDTADRRFRSHGVRTIFPRRAFWRMYPMNPARTRFVFARFRVTQTRVKSQRMGTLPRGAGMGGKSSTCGTADVCRKRNHESSVFKSACGAVIRERRYSRARHCRPRTMCRPTANGSPSGQASVIDPCGS
jgi:hypothetical protein